MEEYPYLILKSGREKSVLNKHPWVFSGGVKLFPKSPNGSVVTVVNNHEQILGYGFYCPNSQIVVRMFHWGETKTPFDLDYWTSKIEIAYAKRKLYINNATTNTYRLLHAEGDFMPGIIADVYDQIVVIQILIKGTEKIYKTLIEAIINVTQIKYVYIKQKESSKNIEGLNLEKGWFGNIPSDTNITIKENNIFFKISPETGQKTGFFIDQRENRALTENWSKGKKVLNAFCYTGGFSLYALRGGADKVTSVDISKEAIHLCTTQIDLNDPNWALRHEAVEADCFDYLRKTDQKFDVIILDPPAFAKHAKAVNNASRGYKDINYLALKLLNKSGILFTYSCSQNISKDLFQKIVFSAAAETGRNIQIVKFLNQPEDHPINIYHPEGEYLKGLMLIVD